MSIYVKLFPTIIQEPWGAYYDDRYDLFYISMYHGLTPYITLQGSTGLIIDIDQNHRIVAIESILSSASTFWIQDDSLVVPNVQCGQINVTQDVEDDEKQKYFTNSDYSVFYTSFGQGENHNGVQHIAIANQIILDVNNNGKVIGIWITDLPSEIRQYHLQKRI